VEAVARPITVYRADLVSSDDERARYEIECSSGTYVRSLITDLGDAYCEELERTAIGPFRLEDASEERIVPLNEALDFLPERVLEEDEAMRAANGVALQTGNWQLATGDHARLVYEGRLLAIAEPRDDTLKPIVVFK
jgi:tRNA pseudouridine55 synthase